MSRLTKLEKELAVRAMEFVKAGEWPWAPDMDGTSEKTMEREMKALDSAIRKLSETSSK
jgi:hypothetical protein